MAREGDILIKQLFSAAFFFLIEPSLMIIG
jgi:hypothetical protein